MMQYDIAEILEIRDTDKFLHVMQEEFEHSVKAQRTFRVTATPADLGTVQADLESEKLLAALEGPPNPHGRFGGWVAKPLRPVRRTALGFENERTDYHHFRFVKNGHLEFWTAIDQHFCWMQPSAEMAQHPRLYPYPVVEYPVSFARMYKGLMELLKSESPVVLQMQYVNVRGAILLPYRPESLGFQHPLEPVTPLQRDRLLFPKKPVARDFDPDRTALELIKDLYHEFGYGRSHIPFFDDQDHCIL